MSGLVLARRGKHDSPPEWELSLLLPLFLSVILSAAKDPSVADTISAAPGHQLQKIAECHSAPGTLPFRLLLAEGGAVVFCSCPYHPKPPKLSKPPKPRTPFDISPMQHLSLSPVFSNFRNPTRPHHIHPYIISRWCQGARTPRCAEGKNGY